MKLNNYRKFVVMIWEVGGEIWQSPASILMLKPLNIFFLDYLIWFHFRA